jgi:hypothetical protein
MSTLARIPRETPKGGLAWNCLRALAIAVGVGLRTIVGGMSFW